MRVAAHSAAASAGGGVFVDVGVPDFGRARIAQRRCHPRDARLAGDATLATRRHPFCPVDSARVAVA
jgi:hypothetical protein